MPLQPYEVTLEPLGKFFFGEEVTFGQGGNNSRRDNYLVKSAYLPQQTSLLGVLRYAVLQHTKKLAPYSKEADRERAVELVGTTGFKLEDDVMKQTPQAFGAIHAIGPLSLRDLRAKGLPTYLPHPIDVGTGKQGASLKWSQTPGGTYWKLDNYDPKEELKSSFATTGKTPIPTEDLFEAQAQAGNCIGNRLYRAPNGVAAGKEDEGYFRQTFRRNSANHRFAFVFRALLDEGVLGADAGAMDGLRSKVCLGGERSLFSLSLTRVGKAVAATDEADLTEDWSLPTQPNTLPANAVYRRLLLLSDTYLPKSLLTDQDFVVAHPKPFRFLSSSLAKGQVTQNFARRNEDDRYSLLERGGVILTPNDRAVDLRDAIQNIEPFFQIGYNYCQYV